MPTDNLGNLIELEQLKDGKEIKKLITKYKNLDFFLDVYFNKRIQNLQKTVDNFMDNDVSNFLSNATNTLINKYEERINALERKIEELSTDNDMTISLDYLDDDLRNLILSNSKGIVKNGKAFDRFGRMREVEYSFTFTNNTYNRLNSYDLNNIFTDKFSINDMPYISKSEFYGNSLENNFNNKNSVEVYYYGPTVPVLTTINEKNTSDYARLLFNRSNYSSFERIYLPRMLNDGTIIDDEINNEYCSAINLTENGETFTFNFKLDAKCNIDDDILFKVIKYKN